MSIIGSIGGLVTSMASYSARSNILSNVSGGLKSISSPRNITNINAEQYVIDMVTLATQRDGFTFHGAFLEVAQKLAERGIIYEVNKNTFKIK